MVYKVKFLLLLASISSALYGKSLPEYSHRKFHRKAVKALREQLEYFAKKNAEQNDNQDNSKKIEKPPTIIQKQTK